MTDFIRVDAHVHLYRSTEEGQTEKAGYEVWEYGEQAEVHQTDCVGTLDELLVQMEATGISKACLLYTSPSPRDRTRSRMPSSA